MVFVFLINKQAETYQAGVCKTIQTKNTYISKEPISNNNQNSIIPTINNINHQENYNQSSNTKTKTQIIDHKQKIIKPEATNNNRIISNDVNQRQPLNISNIPINNILNLLSSMTQTNRTNKNNKKNKIHPLNTIITHNTIHPINALSALNHINQFNSRNSQNTINSMIQMPQSMIPLTSQSSTLTPTQMPIFMQPSSNNKLSLSQTNPINTMTTSPQSSLSNITLPIPASFNQNRMNEKMNRIKFNKSTPNQLYPRTAIIGGKEWFRHYSRPDRKYYWLLKDDKNDIIDREWDPWRKYGLTAPWRSSKQKWYKFTDPTEKKQYYYNYENQQSTFERPDGYKSDPDIEYDSADNH